MQAKDMQYAQAYDTTHQNCVICAGTPTMKKICFLFICLLIHVLQGTAQSNLKAEAWADSVLQSLTPQQRIAQLMILRLSSYDFKTRTPIYYDSLVAEKIRQYNIGGVCVFQGHPVALAEKLNQLQALAPTPLMVCIDGEWGVGMRLIDSVQSLPRQMMLGAVQDPSIIYRYGTLVAAQCKRLGIHVNYAPVVDVNNNPLNPVINDRSFGEDKYRVAAYGAAYMRGMQDAGVMACAKHFPGHGDVATDSHYDLPVILKTRSQLDSLELYPFRELIRQGVGSVMVAHLFIPAIDSTANQATSLSAAAVQNLLREELGYNGLTFTDALEMQGVKKFFPDGEAAARSIIAGNDLLCLPGEVETTLSAIEKAIQQGQLSQALIDQHCRKVLLAKYKYVTNRMINPGNITADLNAGIVPLKQEVARKALTVLSKKRPEFFPLRSSPNTKIAYIGIGITEANAFAGRIQADHQADLYYFSYRQPADSIASLLSAIRSRYDKIIIGLHAFNRRPENNFGVSPAALELLRQLQGFNSCLLVFGNPYLISNLCGFNNLVACYEDDAVVQEAAADWLQGKWMATGRLPVSVCPSYPVGSGLIAAATGPDRFAAVDSIAAQAIAKGALPGCVVLALKDGRIAFHRAYGQQQYGQSLPVDAGTVYDAASLTKIFATTLALMKLHEQGKFSLLKKAGDYLPELKGTDKSNISIEELLLHQGGLQAFIPFYKSFPVSDTLLYQPGKSEAYPWRVGERLYLRKDGQDSLMRRIVESPLGVRGRYVYSDLDFILLGKIVEKLAGMPLDAYMSKYFYRPMGLTTAGFRPRNYLPLARIAPTEQDTAFRKQLLQGDVHDPAAAMMGGVAGHAGLFSNAYDLGALMQLLMNGGRYNGKQYLKKSTVNLFTSYHSTISRRGLGFDKPEKDNAKRTEPYPCASASPATFGHTGFTGTCAWADPETGLVFIFLSNRVHPDGNNRLMQQMNIRPAIHETLYRILVKKK